MKSDTIMIDNQGNGFQAALDETMKAARYQKLSEKDALYLQLCAEEMLSLARSVTGEMQASYWLENDGPRFEMHMCTKTVMDSEKRYLLISSTTSRKNEAAKSFLGWLRNAFEEAMASDVDHSDQVSDDLPRDVFIHPENEDEWDGYERSILRKVADQVKISVRGRVVDMTVIKDFS